MKIPLQGSIKDTSLVKILVYLNRSIKTGTLAVSTSSAIKKIYLKMGDVIFASSTYEDDRLGEMLLKAGKITVEQYDESVRILKSTGKKQGAILVELEYLTPKELFWGLKYQVNEIIQGMFLLEDAQYEFREGDIPAQEVISLKMSMGNLIYAGINRITNWTRIRNEMPDTDSVLKLSDNPLTLFQDIELSPQDKKILSLIDGEKNIKEIIDNSWMGSFEALRILYVLWSIGMIELAAVQKEASSPSKSKKRSKEVKLKEILEPVAEDDSQITKINSLYSKLESLGFDELLSVGKDTDSETIKKRYFQLAKEYHPDKHLTYSGPDTKMKLTRIYDALTNAYNILSDDKLKGEYYRSLASPEIEKGRQDSITADGLFKKGIKELKKGNFPGAIDKFTSAINLEPNNTTYLSHLSLTYSKVPGKTKEAEEMLLRAIKLEPLNADLHAKLGLIYIKAGSKKKALISFQKALKIDPQHNKALKGLEQAKS